MRGQRGHTIAEMLVSIVLLGLILGAILFFYLTGTRAVAQGDLRTELNREIQVATINLTREIETSCYDGLSTGPGSLALLSAVPFGGGTPGLGSDGSVVWRKYVVFWLDPATQSLMRKEYEITPTTNGKPIEQWEGKTLADYLLDGRVVSRHLTAFTPTVPAGSHRLSTTIEVEQKLRGEPKRSSLTFDLKLKN